LQLPDPLMRDGRTLHNLKAKKLKADGQSNPEEASKIIQRGKALAKLEKGYWEIEKPLKWRQVIAVGLGTYRVHVI
jgi:hypothetical protein